MKYFDDFQNRNFFSFMTNVNPNNGNEMKLEIFQICFIKKYQGVLMTFKTKISQFYDLSEPKQCK